MPSLTVKEKAIFNLLLKVVEEMCPNVTLRVAGGWVRDKLLGLESDDIDITVDVMSGLDFAKHVHEYMAKNGVKVGTPAKIAANTEANKNLESAILRIKGIEVDFTQLRREFYTDDSRNPEVETDGVTPEEDARRRDLTINALFYNIHTSEIEDYVGGKVDLEQRVARTPIDPLRTFLDDPLRILRCIRFAARFDLSIDPEIKEAAKDEDVRKALIQKVSRERVWKEFSKFMIGPRFSRAASLIEEVGLRDFLLEPGAKAIEIAGYNDEPKAQKWKLGFGDWDMDQNNPNHTYDVWKHTLSALAHLEASDQEQDDNDRLVRNVAMLLHDIGKCDVCSQQIHPEGGWSTYHDHQTSSAIAADVILRQLKAPNDVRERVTSLAQHHMRLHLLPSKSKSGLRRVLRSVGAEDWKNLVEMSKADSLGKEGASLDPKYDAFDNYIKEFIESLDGKSEVKPPINGHQVMEILGLSPGREVGIVMDSLKEKLIEEPEMTEAQAIEFIKNLEV